MKEQNTEQNKRNANYDYATHRLRDADGYDISGHSEFTRERSDPYEMVDYLIDRDFSSREDILEAVRDSLARSPELDASGIEVSVRGNLVILSGSVRSKREAHLAEILSQDLPGVGELKNELHYAP